MSLLLPNAQQQFCDGNGIPLAGGFVYTYTVGTTTPAVTYSDYLLTVPNTNPVVLDGNGRAQIWGVGAFQQLVTDQYGNQIWNQVTSDGSINPATLFAPISGSPYYAPASGSPNYAPASGSAFYAAIGGSASQTFLVAPGAATNSAVTLAQAQAGSYGYSYDTGSVNGLAGTLAPAITGYGDGQEIRIRVANANTGASTLNVNGVGAAAIILQNGSALSGGEMASGKISVFVYNAAFTAWQLLNPLSTISGLGVGQTWQNKTSTRAVGSSYTNSGAKPIMISATVAFNGGSGQLAALTSLVNGAAIGIQESSISNSVQYLNVVWVVPAGATYGVNASISGSGTVGAINNWSELS